MNNSKQVTVPISLLLNPLHLLSLGFGSGLSPKMPGTVGTLSAVVLYLILPDLDWYIYLGFIGVAFFLGCFLCAYTAKALDTEDHPAIVWDEIVGYLITMFMMPKSYLWIILGFILFRLFDIFKPWPISFVDKYWKGGFGIMMDDVLAGIFSLILMQTLIYLS